MFGHRPRPAATVKLFCYCRSCVDQYGLPVGEGNRLLKAKRCELCGQVAVRYFSDKTLTAKVCSGPGMGLLKPFIPTCVRKSARRREEILSPVPA